MPEQAPPRSAPPTADKCSWEEFKLYFETTEKVIDRRVSLNTWNYGLCVAILGGFGVVANWAMTSGGLRLVVLAAIALVAGMGWLLCRFWIGQIRDLKLLNNAKFVVLNEMASRIHFPGGEVSSEPFDREWEILERQGAITHSRRWNVAVLKSSNAELLLPRMFMTMFAGIFLLVVALCFFNSETLLKDPLSIPADAKKGAAT